MGAHSLRVNTWRLLVAFLQRQEHARRLLPRAALCGSCSGVAIAHGLRHATSHSKYFVTRHTPHVTRHTPHTTRHTSHAMHHSVLHGTGVESPPWPRPNSTPKYSLSSILPEKSGCYSGRFCSGCAETQQQPHLQSTSYASHRTLSQSAGNLIPPASTSAPPFKQPRRNTHAW